MPFFLVEKSAKSKRLFCHIFPKVKFLIKLLDIFEKEKLEKNINKI